MTYHDISRQNRNS